MKINNSEECAKSELDLFSVPPTQTAIEEGVWDTIQPHQYFEESPIIRFDIPGTNQNYIDLSQTELHVTCKFKNGDKDVLVVNNLLHSLFQQVQISLNNSPVENTNRCYAYRAYIENLLCYNKESKNTFLANCGWIKDTKGSFKAKAETTAKEQIDDFAAMTRTNSTWSSGNTDGVTIPPGYLARTKLFWNGTNYKKEVQLCGKLHCDVTNLNRYLLNNVNVGITLHKAPAQFYLKGPDWDKENIIFTRACLKVRRVNIANSVMLAHAMALEKTTAKYPIKRVVVKQMRLPGGSKFTLQGIENGIMPTRVVVGFIENRGFSGDKLLGPFNFKDLKCLELCLKISSKALPYSTSLQMDYDSKNYREAYNTLFKNIREAPNDITYEEYIELGNVLYAFDLSPDLCSGDHYNLLKDGSLDLDITLKSRDPRMEIDAIFYLEFDNIIEINKDRNVLYDYKV